MTDEQRDKQIERQSDGETHREEQQSAIAASTMLAKPDKH